MRTVVVTDPPRADVDDAETLGDYGVATVHEALGRVGYLGPELRPAWPGARIGGTAVTVLCWPGDNLMIHVAVEQCRPGDVLVVATNSPSHRRSVRRAVRHRAAAARCPRRRAGLRGARRRGPARDGFPAWSRAVSAQGTVKATPGAVNVPVVLGGQTVHPGDVRGGRRRRRHGGAARGRRPGAHRVPRPRGQGGGRPRRVRGRRAGPRPLRPARRGWRSSASSTSPREVRTRRAAMADYDSTGVRATMLRGGTSRGLYFEAARPARRPGRARRPAAAADGHARPAPDRRARRRHLADQQGRRRRPLGAPRRRRRLPVPAARGGRGRRSATGRTAATSSPGSGRSPSSAGWSPRGRPETGVRIRMVNSDSIAVATFPRPAAGSSTAATSPSPGVPGTAAPVALAFTDTEGSATGEPAAHRTTCGTPIDGIEVTCVDNGMPVVLALAESFGLTGDETPRGARRATPRCSSGWTRSGRKAGAAHGPRRRVGVVGAEDGAARPAPRRRPGRHPLVHPGAAAHRDRRARRGQRGHRDAAARGRRARAHGRVGRATARGSTSSTRPATSWSTSSWTPTTTPPRVPFRGRPHRPQALRRHGVPPRLAS